MTAMLSEFRIDHSYLLLFTNHPLLWTGIVILFMMMVALRILIAKRDRQREQRVQKEGNREKFKHDYIQKFKSKRHGQPDLEGKEPSEPLPLPEQSRWAASLEKEENAALPPEPTTTQK